MLHKQHPLTAGYASGYKIKVPYRPDKYCPEGIVYMVVRGTYISSITVKEILDQSEVILHA